MLFRVDPSNELGLADQLAAQVRGQLAEGTLAVGDRLPPARQVAAGLKINMHTVLRAYQILRDEGLIELRRGRGAQIAAFDVGALGLERLIDELAAAAVALDWTPQRTGAAVTAAMAGLIGRTEGQT